MMRRLLWLALTISLCSGCGAWNESAPQSSTGQCPAFDQALTVIQTHIEQGHTTSIAQWMQRSTEHVTVLVDFALSHANIETTTKRQDAGLLDGSTTEAIWQALLPVQASETDITSSQDQAQRCARAIDVIGGCLTPSIVQLIETIAADPRGPLRVQTLLEAAGQRRAFKQASLASLGLDEQDAFVTLATSLLNSLSDPQINAETLVGLLQGIGASQRDEKSILSALINVILVLITDPQQQLSQDRRLLTAKALSCLRPQDRSEAMAWLLFRILVALDLPKGVNMPTLPNLPDELLAEIRSDEALLFAARSWLQTGFAEPKGTSLVVELRDVTQGPVAEALATMLKLMSGQSTCESDDE